MPRLTLRQIEEAMQAQRDAAARQIEAEARRIWQNQAIFGEEIIRVADAPVPRPEDPIDYTAQEQAAAQYGYYQAVRPQEGVPTGAAMRLEGQGIPEPQEQVAARAWDIPQAQAPENWRISLQNIFGVEAVEAATISKKSRRSGKTMTKRNLPDWWAFPKEKEGNK